MAEHSRLRSTGGPRGELEQGRLVLVDGHTGQRCIWGERLQVGEVLLDDHDGHPGIGTLQTSQALRVGHQQLRGGVGEGVLDLVAGPPAVARHRHRSQRHRRPERDDPLRAVGGQDRHPVTGNDTPVSHGGRHRGHQSLVAGEGQNPPACPVVEDGVVGIAEPAGLLQEFPERPVPLHEDLHGFAQHVLDGHLEWATGR